MARDRIVTGKEFLQKLLDLDVIPLDTRRVVIDAAWNDLVMVYVEQLGTERLLSVTPTLEGIKIQIVGEEEDVRTH